MSRASVRKRGGPGMGTWPWHARPWFWVVTWIEKCTAQDSFTVDRHRICKTKGEAELNAEKIAQWEGARNVRMNYTCRIVKH